MGAEPTGPPGYTFPGRAGRAWERAMRVFVISLTAMAYSQKIGQIIFWECTHSPLCNQLNSKFFRIRQVSTFWMWLLSDY